MVIINTFTQFQKMNFLCVCVQLNLLIKHILNKMTDEFFGFIIWLNNKSPTYKK
jgi:hypothetical protein